MTPNRRGFRAPTSLTQFYQKDFERAGLKIDTTEYGRWVERSAHRRWHYKYNQEWQKLFDSGVELTRAKILGKRDELLRSGNFPETLE